MTIELSESALLLVVAVVSVIVVALMSIRFGRKIERKQWLSLAERQPKNFVHVDTNAYTVLSHDEYQSLNIVEIEGFEGKR